jgi:hypothetical protein
MLRVGAGIAVVIAAPTLAWQQLHGWPQPSERHSADFTVFQWSDIDPG